MLPQPPRPRGEFGAATWFSLSVGHTGRAEARWLLPKICEAGGISRDSIGAIRVRQDETFVQIAFADAPRFGEFVELEPGLTMQRIAGEPVLDRPAPKSGKPGGKPAGKPWPRKAAERRQGDERGERTDRGDRPTRARETASSGFGDRKTKGGADAQPADRPKPRKKDAAANAGAPSTRKPRANGKPPAPAGAAKPKGRPPRF